MWKYSISDRVYQNLCFQPWQHYPLFRMENRSSTSRTSGSLLAVDTKLPSGPKVRHCLIEKHYIHSDEGLWSCGSRYSNTYSVTLSLQDTRYLFRMENFPRMVRESVLGLALEEGAKSSREANIDTVLVFSTPALLCKCVPQGWRYMQHTWNLARKKFWCNFGWRETSFVSI